VEMAGIYSAMDVLLNPAMGEGYGIPIVEAQACGVPVIVTDFTAMPELVGGGWLVSHKRFWTGHNSWQAVPDVEDILDALNRCHAGGLAGRKETGERARRYVLKYDVRTVFEEHMLPSLKEAERRFADRRPVELKVAA
jgi:glycosyltransferase involved in cell wall biosynthesis